VALNYIFFKFRKKIKIQNEEIITLNTLKEKVYSTLVHDIKELLFPITVHIANTSNTASINNLEGIYTKFIKKINTLLIDVSS
ncbi:MAG: hypothetical protein ABSG15_15290, partial [FCB group bacterium]